MSAKNIIPHSLLSIILERLCQEILENHDKLQSTALVGIQPKGTFVAQRIATILEKNLQKKLLLGYLDITFFRDDFRRRSTPLAPNATYIDFTIEGKKVILIDDVLYTGRTVRAALDALLAFGRPASVELLVLIDRKHSRQVPIEAKYIGKAVHTFDNERIRVQLREQGFQEDSIYLEKFYEKT